MKTFVIDHTNLQQALESKSLQPAQPAPAPANWYTSSTEEDTQGLIYNEKTGQNIAVCYNPKHAALIAAAPDLLTALEIATVTMETIAQLDPANVALSVCIKRNREAIKKARS